MRLVAEERLKLTKADATSLINQLCGGGQDVDFIQVKPPTIL